MRQVLTVGLLALATSLVGCDRQIALPTFDPGEFCSAGLMLPVLIEADPAAYPPVWGTTQTGERVELVWPVGFTATHTGDGVEIADSSGRVVARSGQMLIGAGGGSLHGATVGLCHFSP